MEDSERCLDVRGDLGGKGGRRAWMWEEVIRVEKGGVWMWEEQWSGGGTE